MPSGLLRTRVTASAATCTPSPLNPLGVKGAGESGVIAAAPAVMSAIENALEPFGVRIAQMPLPPHKLLELIAEAKERNRR